MIHVTTTDKKKVVRIVIISKYLMTLKPLIILTAGAMWDEECRSLLCCQRSQGRAF